jgi:hypothetical protein
LDGGEEGVFKGRGKVWGTREREELTRADARVASKGTVFIAPVVVVG